MQGGGAGATLSEGHSKTAIDESHFGVQPDPKVCAAVDDVLDGMHFVHTSEGTGSSQGCSIGAPLFFSMLDDDEGEVTQLAGEETSATMFFLQGNASACGDSGFLQSMKIDDEEEDACWETRAEMLSRQGTVLARDVGDLILQSNDNGDDEVAFCGIEKDDEVAFGATMLAYHQALLAYDDGDGVLPYNEEQEIVL